METLILNKKQLLEAIQNYFCNTKVKDIKFITKNGEEKIFIVNIICKYIR